MIKEIKISKSSNNIFEIDNKRIKEEELKS